MDDVAAFVEDLPDRGEQPESVPSAEVESLGKEEDVRVQKQHSAEL
jgi:hypothetical protein